MNTLSSQFIDKSVSAALSAIETTIKPNFAYREESFVILIINAWELLLKGKMLADNKDNPESIFA